MKGLHWPSNTDYATGELQADSPNHCVAVTPEGKLLDIHGLKAKDNAKEVGWTGRTPLTKEQIVEGLEYYVKPDLEAALPFARTILAREGYKTKNTKEKKHGKPNSRRRTVRNRAGDRAILGTSIG